MQTSLICKKEKTTSWEKWLLGGVLQKSFPKNFTKFTEKYPCYSFFIILLKIFKPPGLQLYWREISALVFQNQSFVDHLQNRCSWIIHKIQRKIPMLESLLNKVYQWTYTDVLKNNFKFHGKAPVSESSLIKFQAPEMQLY